EPVARLQDGTEITMIRKWAVKKGRPYTRKLDPVELFVTGQRILDTLFPIALGGSAIIPGGFGTGKTVVEQLLAKYSLADVVVYVGCGERGNEMTDVLTEFPELIDPRSNRPLLERTVLIANTSNMPVAAREASVYTGITIAEFFRNMGFDVAVMADSTSRWAEALREMSGRLEEMPGEEGYPAYLTSRIAGFYERSGVVSVGDPPRNGSVSVIGAVSPPGGDLSDPVVQATLRMVKVFWALEDKLAYQRHFPAINWLNSYSLYLDDIKDYYDRDNIRDFLSARNAALKVLQEESDLQEIVRLVGVEALSDEDRLILDTAKILREDFLHQHAFDPQDSYTTLKKQYKMLSIIMMYFRLAKQAVEKNAGIKKIIDIPSKSMIARMKYMDIKKLDEVEKALKDDLSGLISSGGENNEGI
ncbi:MAG: V-type ATP synthase subunit A, partial [bacterium]